MLIQKVGLILLGLCCVPGISLRGQDFNLMPQPAELSPGRGRLVVDGTFRVALTGCDEPRLEAAVRRLVWRLSELTGIPMNDEVEPDPSQVTLEIHCDHAGERVQSLREDESYQLVVTAQHARLAAPTPLGVLRGIQTFLQLVDLDAHGFGAPAVEIRDRPRFAWRGLLVDVSRHWMPVPVIKRNLDAMAALKLNVLHWHLSDDQGFRIESKRFPKLQGLGSEGDYYTQDQVRDIVAYAQDRGIRVVPEFDMPGHTTAWFVGYPELASAPGPYVIERAWGVFDPCMDPTREEVYRFLDTFVGEMAALFPDEYFHIGGDEVNGTQWDHSPRIQSFRQVHGLKDNAELQAYFNHRLLPIVQKHGKKMMGWDEIFRPDLPKSVVVHSWRGRKSLAEAARQGYAGILSHGYYLGDMQPASFHYAVDPLEGETAGLTPEQQARILGGEACMWAEYVTPENIDGRIWPRTAAIAERLWSPATVKDMDSMYRRLAIVSGHLEWLGLTHRSSYTLMLERLTNLNSPGALRMLAEVLEPLPDRSDARLYTSLTPLTRLADATPPESDAAREFARLVASLTANKDQVRRQLTLWREGQAELLPAMRRSALLQEAVPLAEDVAALVATGLEALDFMDAGKPAPAAWATEHLALLDRAAKPRADLRIAIVPSIRKLLEAASH